MSSILNSLENSTIVTVQVGCKSSSLDFTFQLKLPSSIDPYKEEINKFSARILRSSATIDFPETKIYYDYDGSKVTFFTKHTIVTLSQPNNVGVILEALSNMFTPHESEEM
jgi:hypothetical protein